MRCFYPHAPGGARLIYHTRSTLAWPCFYPHAPGGARLVRLETFTMGDDVSIRTPRAGRDDSLAQGIYQYVYVSIRTPRAGRDSHPPF